MGSMKYPRLLNMVVIMPTKFLIKIIIVGFQFRILMITELDTHF